MFYFMIDTSFWDIAFSTARNQTCYGFSESNRFNSENFRVYYCDFYEEEFDKENETNTYLRDILI